MIGDGSTEWTATEGPVVAENRVDPRAIMDWSRFVRAWSEAHDGFDLRHAGAFLRTWGRFAYRVAIVATRFGLGTVALTGAALFCAAMVPLLAAGRGSWALPAALLVVLGVAADSVSRAVGVLLGRTTRLDGFYRCLVDRIGEVCWLLAAGQLGAAPVLLLLCGVLLFAHEYMRARACAAGMRAAGAATIGDRSTRFVLTLAMLVVAASVTPLSADLAAGTSTVFLAVWVVLGVFGLVQLLAIVRKALR